MCSVLCSNACSKHTLMLLGIQNDHHSQNIVLDKTLLKSETWCNLSFYWKYQIFSPNESLPSFCIRRLYVCTAWKVLKYQWIIYISTKVSVSTFKIKSDNSANHLTWLLYRGYKANFFQQMGWNFNSNSISIIGMTFCWTWHVLQIYLEMSKYTSLNIELHESVVGTFFYVWQVFLQVAVVFQLVVYLSVQKTILCKKKYRRFIRICWDVNVTKK